MTTLRIAGAGFLIERFLAESPLRGALAAPDEAVVPVSVGGWDDFAAQLRDVELFLSSAKREIGRLRPTYLAERVWLDLPANRRLGERAAVRAFPAALLTTLGALAIDLQLSVHPPDLSGADREHNRIASHPEVCQGRPVIRGTRVLVATIVGALANGESPALIAEHHPDIGTADVLAAAYFVAERAEQP